MTWRAVKAVVVVVICWSVATHLEDMARYLRMRDMSRRDNHAAPPAPDPRT